MDWLKQSESDPQIDLNGVPVPIALRRHRTAKRLTLRLATDGSEVRVTLPYWANAKEAIAFARSREEWLEEQHAKVPKRQPIKQGTTIQFRGDPLEIEWKESAHRHPEILDKSVRISGPISGIEKRLQRWMEREAMALFEMDMIYYTKAAELERVPVGISRAQRRWGSCSEKQRIRINWRLIQAPDFVRRSVVAHEVTHLIHFDHSPAFHAMLGQIYEGDIKQADRWLKEHGRKLYSAFG